MDKPIERIRAAIEDTTGPGRHNSGGGWQMRCPAHSDRNPSLSVDANPDDHVLLYCQAGCDTDAVLAAVGLTRRDLYPKEQHERSEDPVVATYRYTDEQNTLLYEVQRTAAKRFRQRRPDPDRPGKHLYNLQGVRRVLYRLPLVLDAIEQGQPVYLVEGEKDVHSIETRNRVATTNPGGAGKWRPEYTEALRGAHILIVTDRDREGQGLRHARAVQTALTPVCASVTLLQPATGKDVTDHLVAGLDLDALEFVGVEMPAEGSEAADGQAEAIDDTSEQAPANPVRLRPASLVRVKPVHWVWADRIPVGEICLIPGREGIGKSIFLAWLAAQITRGTLPGIYEGQPRTVMYAAAEDSWPATIVPRMIAAGADLDLIQQIDVADLDEGTVSQLSLPRDCRHIPQAAIESKSAVLMLDPILSNLDDRLNPNQTRELRQALEPLRRAAEDAQIAVIALAHFNKTTEGDVLSKIAGGRGWAEVARAVISIAREKRETDDTESHVQVLTQSKNNLGRVDLDSLEYQIEGYDFPTDPDDSGHHEMIRTARLSWTGVSLTSAEEILGRRHEPRQTQPRRANIERVLDALDDATVAVSPREVSDALGDIPHQTVKQILHRLASQGQIERVGTGLYKPKTQLPGSDQR